MNAVPIQTARLAGQCCGARAVVIIYVDGDENFGITTWGKTRQECRALAKWAESTSAEEVAGRIAEAIR